MLVLSDKSLIAPPKLTAWIESIAAQAEIPLQLDMFSNGGTDGGAVHLSGTGIPTVVLGPRNPPRTLCRLDCRLSRHSADTAVAVGADYRFYARYCGPPDGFQVLISR